MTSRAQNPANRVFFTADAEADMDRHPSFASRFQKSIVTLAERPDRGHLLTQDPLGGMYSLELTKNGGGLRAVYRWNQEDHFVVVFAIGPHKSV